MRAMIAIRAILILELPLFCRIEKSCSCRDNAFFIFFKYNIYYIDVYICWDCPRMLIAKDNRFVKFIVAGSAFCG